MKTIINNKIGTLIHIYDYLHGGYFVGHHQLQYYDKQAYQLYLNKDKQKLSNLYNTLRADVPNQIMSVIEKSAGIRYFCCDDCHDAKITNAYFEDNFFIIQLNTNGMLGCLNVGKHCMVKIKTDTKSSCQKLMDDIKTFNCAYWLYSDISFDDDTINFELETQVFTDTSYNNIKYNFCITDIVVE